MTRDEQKTFTTTLLNGYELGDTEFETMLWLAQADIEDMEGTEWQILKKNNQSLSLSPSDAYTDLKSLPTDFMTTLSEDSVHLVSGDDVVDCVEIPMEKREKYKSQFGYFYIDYRQNKIGFTGTSNKVYTIDLWYQYKPADIDDSNSWPFPNRYHPVLCYDIAVNWKGGIDYDAISESQARYNQQKLDQIVSNMKSWNSKLQVRALEGVNRQGSDEVPGFHSGRINL